eukprot:2729401-Pleurochrysis_carterae.AAC.1
MIAHLCPSLEADGRIQSTEPHVRSRVASNSRSSGLPISPPLAASCVRGVRPPTPSAVVATPATAPCESAICRMWCARSPLLSLRDPVGGSSWRMRRSAMASGPPVCSGAISTPASRDRNSLIADT